MARPKKELPDRRKRFVQEYIKDLNATQAAIRAGYSPKTAQEAGSRLLSFVKVERAIERAQAKRAARTQVYADRVIREYARIAFANMADFVEWGIETIKIPAQPVSENGPATPEREIKSPFIRLKDSVNLSEDDQAAVLEIAASQFGPKIKLHPKGPALDKLGDHLGLWKKDPAELLELFLASLPPAVASVIRAGIQQQVSGGGASHQQSNRGTGDATGTEQLSP